MKLVIFNLKSYVDLGVSVKLAAAFNKIRTKCEIAVAPSAISFYPVSKTKNRRFALCAQNFDLIESYGAHTGCLFIEDLKGLGCKYALIGHSEVRRKAGIEVGDSDELVAKKMRSAIEHGIVPVLCFGETRAERENGDTIKVITRQLESAISECRDFGNKKIVVAYEPSWAISGQKGAKNYGVENLYEVRELVKKMLKGWTSYKFLYGASVDGDNINSYMSSNVVDGVIVGRASTTLQSIKDISRNL